MSADGEGGGAPSGSTGDRGSPLGVVGAGTMGAGIARLAAQSGLEVRLHDSDPAVLERAAKGVRAAFGRRATRGEWSTGDAAAAGELLTTVTSLGPLEGCDAVIEAAPERLDVKRSLFEDLAEICGDEALLATNTSSISVTAIAAGIRKPGRLVGMHFFNPPVAMKLVEIVAGEDTDETALERASELARAMGREPVRARDGIGFIANRCARPYTLEGLRMLGEGVGSHEEIDRALRIGGGFRMGPFELMDLVGIDVNFQVARSFFEQSFGEPRWRPHPLHARMARSGRLGRKKGGGFYRYTGDAPHRSEDPPLVTDPPLLSDPYLLAKHAGERAPEILERVAACIANEACFALEDRIASPVDINRAMRLGFNWPLGPFEWGMQLGWSRTLGLLEDLRDLRGEAYRPAPLLRRLAAGAPLSDLAP